MENRQSDQESLLVSVKESVDDQLILGEQLGILGEEGKVDEAALQDLKETLLLAESLPGRLEALEDVEANSKALFNEIQLSFDKINAMFGLIQERIEENLTLGIQLRDVRSRLERVEDSLPERDSSESLSSTTPT